ncbi:MAG: replication initiator protein [Microvirus sp.]|nr:MAG: replication initiator protein [Microvirus sp.]
MSCYHPLNLPKGGQRDLRMTVACGQCYGCRLDRRRDWSIRLMHESQGHEDKCFLTLTYQDENIPAGGTLVKKHFWDFVKRLRHYAKPKKIRYFHCGEYGETTARPHYHAIIFGIDFADKTFYKNGSDGSPLYKSADLDGLWTHGFASIGSVTKDSCGYVAGYILKKLNGDAGAEHYGTRVPPYTSMSLRPGIGREFYDKYADEIYAGDFVVHGGNKFLPPKYYDRIHSQLSEEDLQATKFLRIKRSRSKKNRANNTPSRLRTREEVKKAQTQTLKRSL